MDTSSCGRCTITGGLKKVVFRSLVEYRLDALETFLALRLNRTAPSAGDFIEAIVRLGRGRAISEAKCERIRRAIAGEATLRQHVG